MKVSELALFQILVGQLFGGIIGMVGMATSFGTAA
eukprot:COSAG05_NODE_16663_length_341_cov_0.851240_1_plen_34_part_10